MLLEECRCSQLHADIETEDCLLMFHVSHTLWKLCSGDIWCWWCWSQLDQVNKKSYILQLIVVGSIWLAYEDTMDTRIRGKLKLGSDKNSRIEQLLANGTKTLLLFLILNDII